MPKGGYVYILASRRNGTLYVGVTADLVRRVHRHPSGEAGAFTRRHRMTRLVYYEVYDDIENAILREKRLKRWRRS